MRGTMGQHGKQIQNLHQVANTTSEDVKATRGLLESFVRSQPGGGGPGRVGGAAPKAAPAGGAAPEAAPAGGPPDEFVVPVCVSDVTEEISNSILSLVGIGNTRADIKQLHGAIATTSDGSMPFHLWWGTVVKCKSVTQWRAKLQALGAEESDVKSLNASQIGEFLYGHLDVDGTIQSESMQTIKIL